jgi:cell wall-associated NlpC family hydrolase
MKKFIAIAVLLFTLAGCSASEAAAAIKVETVSTATTSKVEQGLWNPLSMKGLVALHYAQRVKTVTKELNKYVNKTWYVFSGNTPQGWDCSGLVMWYYEQLGITLHHSAYVEKYSGTPHKYSQTKAKVGDIIGFPGHVGIYVGNGYMIHAPHPGVRTQRIKVWAWAKQNWTSNVTFTRLIKTN